jgi:hypothetical protein
MPNIPSMLAFRASSRYEEEQKIAVMKCRTCSWVSAHAKRSSQFRQWDCSLHILLPLSSVSWYNCSWLSSTFHVIAVRHFWGSFIVAIGKTVTRAQKIFPRYILCFRFNNVIDNHKNFPLSSNGLYASESMKPTSTNWGLVRLRAPTAKPHPPQLHVAIPYIESFR